MRILSSDQLLLTGAGTYNLNVGKNALMTANMNNWKFGVSSFVDTDWIDPVSSLSLINESNKQLSMLNYVNEPSFKTYKRTYYNQFDDHDFGAYTAEYHGISRSGVYTEELLFDGCLGFDERTFTIDIPNLYISNTDFNLKLKSHLLLNTEKIEVYNENVIKYPEVDNISFNNLLTDNLNFELNNSFIIRLGDPNKAFVVSGTVSYENLEDQLPNTSRLTEAASNITSVLGVLGLFIPGINDCPIQAAKLLPNLPVIHTADFYINSDYIANFYVKNEFKGFSYLSGLLSGGIIPWPDNLPFIYSINRIGLPDLASIADNMIGVGASFNPIKALAEFVVDDLPGALATTQCNTTIGIGGLPKPLADSLDINTIFSTKLGLFEGNNVRFNVDFLDSEIDKKGLYLDLTTHFPVSLTDSFEIVGTGYILKSGIVGSVSVGLTSLNATLKVDLLDETLAITVGRTITSNMCISSCWRGNNKCPEWYS